MANRYGLEIRASNAGDIAGLCELMSSVGQPIAPRALQDRLEAVWRADGAALIALEWGPPSGLIVLHWRQTLHAASPVAEVTSLMVAPDERRKGIGRLLLKAGAQAARIAGCGAIDLIARADQPELAAFCEATGFAEAGTGYSRPLRKRA